VAPNVRTSASSIKIFAVAAEGDVVIADDHEPPDSDDANDKGEGPYIDYP